MGLVFMSILFIIIAEPVDFRDGLVGNPLGRVGVDADPIHGAIRFIGEEGNSAP